ncbi:MAG TPA: MBL fold metallo-hydrolase [Candidatus Acidoferrales bacterium]|nr:MBL fold metallo-hydrolase [Candidatus Acidoferrales bacterium]
MKLGDFELHLFVAGGWKSDGGMTFGVIPKVLWEKQKPADGDNLVDCSCVGAVIRHRGKVIVCETGIGTKLPEKRARQVRLREPEGLLHGLRRLGVRPDEVDVVLSTHLHWDHAGGMTRRDAEGHLQLTFPKAKHFAHRLEWEFALDPDPRSRAGYYADDITPVGDAGLFELFDGDAEILPGVELRWVGGHTPGSVVPIFRAGDLACAMTGDLITLRPQLKLTWTNGADLDVLRVLQEKARLLEEAAAHRWLVILGHEPEQPAGYLEPDGTWRPEPRLS